MSFGKNPHVVKATAAEQKARTASDVSARVSAWREAAHQWDRAAEREKVDKRVAEYTRNAAAAREEADLAVAPAEPEAPIEPAPIDPRLLN